MTEILDAALAYAAHGWPVFGVPASGRKLPHANCPECKQEQCAGASRCEHWPCHGFHAATRDPDRIRDWWKRWPSDLVAIRTGAPSGLAVVDVDPRNGGMATLARLDAEEILPGTLMAITGSAGLHLFYAHPGEKVPSGANRLGPGVDVKADGAYVIAAPSRHPGTGQRYRWAGDGRFDHPLTPLPERLCAVLRPGPPVPRLVTARHDPGAVRGRLAGLVRTVLDSVEGGRNDRLHWAACRAGEMVAAGEVDEAAVVEVLTRAAGDVGTPHSEALATIRSGLRASRAVAA